VTGQQAPDQPMRVVERVLNGPSANRGSGWRDHVVVVPGGHRPGKPDPAERDRARARLPVAGPRRIVVLGCTVGAGQTMTTLMTGEILTTLRGEPVAVLDLNPGSGSLTERARAVPAIGSGPAATTSRLEVITGDLSGRPARSGAELCAESAARTALFEHNPGATPESAGDVGRMLELVSVRYQLTLADPAAAAVPRVLAVADQLVLVVPASPDASNALAMTLEWLEAHGRGGLAAGAITILNGVSRATMRHVEQAEAVASGRCRAIVRVPWDDRLKIQGARQSHLSGPGPEQQAAGTGPVTTGPVTTGPVTTGPVTTGPVTTGPVSPATVHAYTALAGVLIAGLAETPEPRTAQA
jgi:hypothetical protein